MKLLATIVLAFVTVTVPASAACYGTSSLSTCYDNSGNSYTVNRLGGSTYVYGRNRQTGSTWSQNSFDLGGQTYTYGRASNGNTWNQTSGPYGTYGRDSSGRSFYCGLGGCQ